MLDAACSSMIGWLCGHSDTVQLRTGSQFPRLAPGGRAPPRALRWLRVPAAGSLCPHMAYHRQRGVLMFTLPFVQVSEQTLAAHRKAQLRALSERFRGCRFTYDGTWAGEWPDGHAHASGGMGLLWFDVADCPQCLEHEFPGWTITRKAAEGYEAMRGDQVIRAATRSALVCRLVLATVPPR